MAGDLVAKLQDLAAENHQEAVEFFGMGGAAMERCGVELLERIERTAMMGLWEVLSKVLFFLRLHHLLVAAVERKNPLLCVLVDFSFFHLKLARSLRSRGYVVVYYVPPKVWASGVQRVHQLRQSCDFVAGFLPFERDFFLAHRIPYVLVDFPHKKRFEQVVAVEWQRERERALSLGKSLRVVGILPGSRLSEVKRTLKVLAPCMQRLRLKAQNEGYELRFAVAVSELIPVEKLIGGLLGPSYVKTLKKNSGSELWQQETRLDVLDVSFFRAQSLEVMSSCDSAVITSGTAALECALLGTPHVVIYKVHPLSYLYFKNRITVPYASLVNLSLGSEVNPEFLQRISSEEVAEQVWRLTHHSGEDYARWQKSFQALQKMYLGGACVGMAELIYDHYLKAPPRSSLVSVEEGPVPLIDIPFYEPRPSQKKSSPHLWHPLWHQIKRLGGVFWLWPLSKIYAGFMLLRRFFYTFLQDQGWWVPYGLPGKVMSVGNLSLGGSGKTPVVMALAEHLSSKGYKVVVLSRGYGSSLKSSEVGYILGTGEQRGGIYCADFGGPKSVFARRSFLEVGVSSEKLYLDEAALVSYTAGVDSVFGRRRIQAARYYLATQSPPDYWLMDDGFQYFGLRKDQDLLVFDSTLDLSCEGVLPWGGLREPLRSKKHAHGWLITRTNQKRLWGVWQGKPCFYLQEKHLGLWRVQSGAQGGFDVEFLPCDVREFLGQPCMLLLGIARPARALEFFKHRGFDVESHMILRDHQHFTDHDLNSMKGEARVCLTTEKDYFRNPGALNRVFSHIIVSRIRTQLPDEFLAYIKQQI